MEQKSKNHITCIKETKKKLQNTPSPPRSLTHSARLLIYAPTHNRCKKREFVMVFFIHLTQKRLIAHPIQYVYI